MEIRNVTLAEWERLLPNSGFDVFHVPEALSVLDDYATGDLRLLAGYRGQEPVGLFAGFVREHPLFRIVMSPPPGLSVPSLGPVLMPTSPKRRKQAELNEQFTKGVLKTFDTDDARTLFGMVGGLDYPDPRPFLWENHGVVPRFNYVVDVEGKERDELLKSFTRDLRKEIRTGEELDQTTGVEGPAQAERVCRNLKRRHEEQGLSYPVPEGFSGDLVDALNERARVYVARSPDGDYLGGMTILYSNNKALFWQGGAKANYQNVSVNSLLHWEVIKDIRTDPELDSIERYDLGAVNNRRIARFKSKFNPELVAYYEVKSDLMAVAKKCYSAQRHLLGRLLRLTPHSVRQVAGRVTG